MTACLIATQFPRHVCIDDFTTESSFDSQRYVVIDVLDLFLYMLPVCLNNQVLADVRSTGGGITCLYCSCTLRVCAERELVVPFWQEGLDVLSNRLCSSPRPHS